MPISFNNGVIGATRPTYQPFRIKSYQQLSREYGILIGEIAPHVEVCTLAIANAFRKIERRMRSD